MTTRAKQWWGDAGNIAFKALLSTSAFFMIQAYNKLDSIDQRLNEALTKGAVMRVEVDANTALLKEHGSILRHLEHLDYDNTTSIP